MAIMITVTYSQTNYQVISLGSNYSMEQIEASLDAADLCGFYYSNERRALYFDDGAIAHLFKKSEAPFLASSCFIFKEEDTNDYDDTWKISTSGHLVRRISINPTK